MRLKTERTGMKIWPKYLTENHSHLLCVLKKVKSNKL